MNKEEAYLILKEEFASYCIRYPVLCKKLHDKYIMNHYNQHEALANVLVLLLQFSWQEENIFLEYI